MSENPDDWRSAVDASSGRTYWYHRKTRVSTWIRPDFAEPTTTAELQQHNRDSQKDTAKTNHDTESIHCSNSTVVPQNSPFTSTFKRILLKMAQNPQQSVVAEHTSLLETVDKHNFLEADAGEIISQLVHVSILSQDGYGARHAALRCLLYLSETQEHEFAARFFHTNQAWTSLAAYAPTWKWKVLSSSVAGDSINDPESILLVSALMCNLFIGPTYYSISEESKDCLVELLDSTFIQNTDSIVDFDVLLRNRASGGGDALQLQSTAVLSDRTVQTYTLLAEKGHSLPAVWLLAIFTQSFR